MTHKQSMVASFMTGCGLLGSGFDLSNATLGVVGVGCLAMSILMYLNSVDK